MAALPASLTAHARHFPDRLSLLLDPCHLNHAGLGLPIAPGLPSSLTALPDVDFVNRTGADQCRNTAFEAFPTLYSKDLIANTIHHQDPSIAFLSNGVNFGNLDSHWNAFNLTNWPMSGDWRKYLEEVRVHSLKAQSFHRGLDQVLIPKWPSKTTGQLRTQALEETQFAKIQRLGNKGEHLKSTDDTMRISPVHYHVNEFEKYTGKAKERTNVKHSIRDILKPQENCQLSTVGRDNKQKRVCLDTLSEDGTSRKLTRMSRDSSMRKRYKTSVIKSKQRSQGKHGRIKHRVISVFTVASSSFAQSIAMPVSKSSRKLTCQSAVGVIDQSPTYNTGVEPVSDYFDPQPLRSSLVRGQNERKSFQCPQCRYITDRKNNLKRHIVTMHQDSGKVLECCGIPFQSKAALRDHNTVFHKGGYRCQICARNFCRKALLRRHLTVHSGQKDFFCDLCGYATSHKSNLERHQKVHTKKPSDLRTVNNKNLSSESLSQITNHKQCDVLSESMSPFLPDDTQVMDNVDKNSQSLEENSQGQNLHPLQPCRVREARSASYTRDMNFSSTHRRKRARFFTSRLEETYDSVLEETSPRLYSPLTETEPHGNTRNIQSVNEHPPEPVTRNEVIPQTGTTHNGELLPGEEEEEKGCVIVNQGLTKHDVRLAEKSGPISPDEIQRAMDSDHISTDNIEDTKENKESNFRSLGNVNGTKELDGISKDDIQSPLDSGPVFQDDIHSPKSGVFLDGEAQDIPLNAPTETKKQTLEHASYRKAPTHCHATKKPLKGVNKYRMCSISYQCDDCGQKLPNQHALQSHSCSKPSPCSILDISLVTALRKGCLKTSD